MVDREYSGDDYSPGDNVLYFENGAVIRAEVVSNDSDERMVGYTLRVLEVVRESPFPFIKEPESGARLSCTMLRGVQIPGDFLWMLADAG